MEIKEKEEEHNNKNLKLVIHDVYENKRVDIELNDDIKIYDIKKKFADENSIDLIDVKLRLLFGGTELQDENFLYQYNIKDGYIIQVLKIIIC